jgi:hypothetical protein
MDEIPVGYASTQDRLPVRSEDDAGPYQTLPQST